MKVFDNNTVSFFNFICQDKFNRKLLNLALIGAILQFIVFKLFYPYPDFFSDSYSYIYVAYSEFGIGKWPIGYSNFLSLFHRITSSDIALVGFQYFFLQIASLYLFYSLCYFFTLKKANLTVLYILFLFNPISLYLSNYVNSDPLFIALSIIWFTQLLWIIFHPTLTQLFTHGFVLLIVFSIRNNAYYYPFITCLGFLLSKQLSWRKYIGILFSLSLVISFIIKTTNETFEKTGTRQFSLFSGWQLANNALYIYDKVNLDNAQFPSQEVKELDNYSREFFKHAPTDLSKVLSTYVGNFFIRQPESPLRTYSKEHYKIVDGKTDIIAWARASSIYSDFGNYIIKNHPIAYFRYFMVINTKNYFLPPLEKLEEYNLGSLNVPTIVQYWFGYKTPTVKVASIFAQGTILFFYPSFFLFANIIFIGSLIWYIVKQKYKHANPNFNKFLLLTSCFQLLNFCFCVSATIIVFRYQIFPLLLIASEIAIFYEFTKRSELVKGPKKKEGETNLHLTIKALSK